MFDLTGKRALITGGLAGIGLRMARGPAKAGAAVAIWGRSTGRLEMVATDLAVHGRTVVTRSVDISDEQAVINGMLYIVDELGGLDVIVVTAGINTDQAKFVDSPTKRIEGF